MTQRERISRRLFDSLLEYSCSLPTLTTIGKVWKRDLNFGTGMPPDWVICEYINHPTDPTKCRIETRIPVIEEPPR